MAETLSQAVNELTEKIDRVTSDPSEIPGVVDCAVNKKGDLTFQHASRRVGASQQQPVDMDSVFWIASCTKMITGIVCMQLVEHRRLSLDDFTRVEKLCPARSGVDLSESSYYP